MEVDDLCRAGPFVEVVAVLGDDGHFVACFEGCDEAVSFVGLMRQDGPPDGVEEVEHTLPAQACVVSPSAIPRFARSHGTGVNLIPNPSASPERGKPALGAHACAGEEHKSFHKAISF